MPAPAAERPTTESSYGIPDGRGDLLKWEHVQQQLNEDRRFWVATVRPDGFPHARPIWGVLVDGKFHCGGGADTRWVRNLLQNPTITVHTEDAASVVILEGTTQRFDAESTDADRLAQIDAAYVDKYGIEHGTPVFAVSPKRVLAWTDFPTDATRWTFER